jgi:hypothetical protein
VPKYNNEVVYVGAKQMNSVQLDYKLTLHKYTSIGRFVGLDEVRARGEQALCVLSGVRCVFHPLNVAISRHHVHFLKYG